VRPRRASLQEATGVTRAFRQQPSPALAAEAARRITMSLSPNERLQHVLHPWTSFVIVPLFALANAGIDLSGDVFGRLFGSPLAIGVIAGLVVGKTLGIPAGAWLATRSFVGGLPLSVGWPSLIAASSVAGIGFTVSLLIADLSYTGVLLEDAKLGILENRMRRVQRSLGRRRSSGHLISRLPPTANTITMATTTATHALLSVPDPLAFDSFSVPCVSGARVTL